MCTSQATCICTFTWLARLLLLQQQMLRSQHPKLQQLPVLPAKCVEGMSCKFLHMRLAHILHNSQTCPSSLLRSERNGACTDHIDTGTAALVAAWCLQVLATEVTEAYSGVDAGTSVSLPATAKSGFKASPSTPTTVTTATATSTAGPEPPLKLAASAAPVTTPSATTFATGGHCATAGAAANATPSAMCHMPPAPRSSPPSAAPSTSPSPLPAASGDPPPLPSSPAKAAASYQRIGVLHIPSMHFASGRFTIRSGKGQAEAPVVVGLVLDNENQWLNVMLWDLSTPATFNQRNRDRPTWTVKGRPVATRKAIFSEIVVSDDGGKLLISSISCNMDPKVLEVLNLEGLACRSLSGQPGEGEAGREIKEAVEDGRVSDGDHDQGCKHGAWGGGDGAQGSGAKAKYGGTRKLHWPGELRGQSNIALSENGRYAATMGHERTAHGSAWWLLVWDLERSSPNPVIHEQLPDGCWALNNLIRARLSISDDGRIVTAVQHVASNAAPAAGPLWRWELGKGLATMNNPPVKQDGRPGKMQVPSYNTECKSCSCYHDFRPCAVTADGSTGVDFYGNEGRVWDLATGTMTTLLGHSDYIRCACITPNGRYAATGAADHTVRVWDVKSGACIALITDKASVEDVVLSPDGRYVLTQGCSVFGAAQVWQLADIDARG